MPEEKLITVEPYALLYTRAGAGVCLRDPLTGKVGIISWSCRTAWLWNRC